MPTYRFRCHECGAFDTVRPMSQATTPASCPDCGETATRIYGVHSVRFVEPGLRAALDASERSADAPKVTTSIPGRSRRATPITRDPRHARLPRP